MAYSSIHAASVDDTDVPVLSAGDPKEIQTNGEGIVGDPNVYFNSIVTKEGKPTFSTRWAYSMLAEITADGAGLASKNLTLFARNWEDGGAWAAGGRSVAAATGVIFPQTLRCEHQGDAVLDVGAVVTSSDGNSPFTVGSSNVSLDDDDERWTLPESITFGGVTVGKLQSVEINFGIVVETEDASSSPWPEIAHIAQRKPTVTISTKDLSLAASFSDSGTAGSCAPSFRNRADGGVFGASTFTLTGSGLVVPVNTLSGSGRRAATLDLRAEIKAVGSNSPFTLSAA